MLKSIDLVDILFEHSPISYVVRRCDCVRHWAPLRLGSTKGMRVSPETGCFHLISVMHTSSFTSKSEPVSQIIFITKEQWR